MKKRACSMLCACLVLSLLCSCASGPSGTKTVKKKNLAALILSEGRLFPGDGLEWSGSEADFLSGPYGSGELDPNSENYQDFRVGRMENGWVCYSPLAETSLREYDLTVKPEYTFNADGELIAAVYAATVPEGSAKSYASMLARMAAEADGADALRPTIGDARDFTEEEVAAPVVLQWTDETAGQYFEINSHKLGNTLFLFLRVSTVDLRAAETFQ